MSSFLTNDRRTEKHIDKNYKSFKIEILLQTQCNGKHSQCQRKYYVILG